MSKYEPFLAVAEQTLQRMKELRIALPFMHVELFRHERLVRAYRGCVKGVRPVIKQDVDLHDNSKCRALLLDVIRRAIHDWVLYRNHRSLLKREVAQHAKTWLFEEEPGHPWWEERQGSDLEPMSLLAICETLDLRVELVRTAAKQTTVQQVMTCGRPPEKRRRTMDEDVLGDMHSTSIHDVDALDHDPGRSFYENRFATQTLHYGT